MRPSRSVVVGVALATSAALLAACSGGGGTPSSSGAATTSNGAATTSNGGTKTDQQVTINYATVTAGDILAKGETPVINAFMAANPNIKVNVESVPVNDFSTKLTTQFRGGQGPDVFRVNASDLQSWAAAGFLQPLDDVITAQGIDKAGLIPGLVQMGANGEGGAITSLPLGTDTRVLYYNPALLATQGISQPPVTWDEMLTDVKKFAGTGNYGFGFMDSGNDYAMVWESVGPFIRSAGGALINSDGTQAIAGTTQATIDATQFVQDLVKTGGTPPGGSLTEQLLAQLFSQGKLAMMLGGPWVRQDILTANPDFVYGTSYLNTVVPVQKAGDVSGSMGGGWFLSINKASKNQEAAAKLVAFLMQKDNLATINGPEAFPPRMDGMSTSPWSDDPFYKAYADQLKGTGWVFPPLPTIQEIVVAFKNAVLPVLLDTTKSVPDALKSFDDTYNTTIANQS